MGRTTPESGAVFSIRTRILIFAVFATLVPSLFFGWISYYKAHELLLKHAEQELKAGLDRSKRELDAWFQRTRDDLSVFSSSFVLAHNLTLHLDPSAAEKQETTLSSLSPAQQIRDFLQLVQAQVPDYQCLRVLDKAGNLIAQFPQLEITSRIQVDWVTELKPGWTIIPQHQSAGPPTLNFGIGVPIVSTSEDEIGMLIAEVPISLVNAVLEMSTGNGVETILIQENGEILMSSLSWKHPQAVASLFRKKPGDPKMTTGLVRYSNYRDVDVVGLSSPLSRLPWRLAIEKPYQNIFGEVDRLRDYSLLLTLGLLTGFGLLAYLVSQSILLPLRRLTQAASSVAKGDLNASLKTKSRDELGFAMTVFDNMVECLRLSRDELQRLSVTDSLTGLYNRKRIMDALDLQFERYRRSGLEFSLLMIDVDHFKSINDEHGHPAGDAALRKIGDIFRSFLRSVDVAGRYGGEEFLIILEQASAERAFDTAERLRAISAQTEVNFNGEEIRFTVSIGVATVVGDWDDTPASLIQRADRALYLAKTNGRNQVLVMDWSGLEAKRPTDG